MVFHQKLTISVKNKKNDNFTNLMNIYDNGFCSAYAYNLRPTSFRDG